MDTFYFTENSLKVIEKITEKGVATGPLCPTPKSIQLQIGTKQEALPGGSPMSPVCILKRLVSVFINACRLLSALPSLSQFGQGRLSLVAISFYTLLLLFGPCRLSEFTLARPQTSPVITVILL